MTQLRMKLVAEFVAGSTRAGAERIAVLNHESRDHAVENESVVKRLLHFLAAFRIGPLLRPLGQTDEVGDRVGRFRLEKLNSKLPFCRPKTRLDHRYAPLVDEDHNLLMLG